VSTSTDGRGEIRIPRETVNDDFVIVQQWLARPAQKVGARDVVVLLETSKAVIEVEAGLDGYVEILHPAGSEVPVGETIGRIVADPAGLSPAPAAAASGVASSRAEAIAPAGLSLSMPAQRLIEEHGLDPSVFAARGLKMVRQSDVIRYLEERRAAAGAAPTAAAAGAGAQGAGRRGLLGDARASAGDRGHGVVWLAWNYFWRNWLLGNLVPLAPRGVINVLHRWRGVKMGRDCFIDPTAILETAYPENITLGNDVRITVRCVIMTHIKSPHGLRGIMPVVIKPVKIGDSAFVGVNSVIMPGVTIGQSAVVASGAVVLGDVPPFTLVAGNPARVVKRFPRPEGGK
jgi:acetyltransferase-like isoleucine patch superfamily enzyme